MSRTRRDAPVVAWERRHGEVPLPAKAFGEMPGTAAKYAQRAKAKAALQTRVTMQTPHRSPSKASRMSPSPANIDGRSPRERQRAERAVLKASYRKKRVEQRAQALAQRAEEAARLDRVAGAITRTTPQTPQHDARMQPLRPALWACRRRTGAAGCGT